VADALEILNQNVLVTRVEREPRTELTTSDRIWWHWRGDYGGSGAGNIIYPQQDDQPKVTRIWLGFPETLTLHEVIQVYGEPSHTIPIIEKPIEGPTGPPVYNLELIYLARGIAIAADYPGTEKPLISPEMKLSRILLFAPSQAGLDAMGEDWDSSYLVAWQGFRDFDWYCQQAQALPHNLCDL
jgi:hypothetical protein